MPVPVVRQICVLVMRGVELTEAFHRGEGRPHHEKIGEQVVLPARRQDAVMRCVVPQDQQRMLARADEDRREHIEHRIGERDAQRDRAGNAQPLLPGGGHGAHGIELGQFLDLCRGQALRDGPARIMRVLDDWVR
jgi:hypothetical protein